MRGAGDIGSRQHVVLDRVADDHLGADGAGFLGPLVRRSRPPDAARPLRRSPSMTMRPTRPKPITTVCPVRRVGIRSRVQPPRGSVAVGGRLRRGSPRRCAGRSCAASGEHHRVEQDRQDGAGEDQVARRLVQEAEIDAERRPG